jgi:hypothetical protein
MQSDAKSVLKGPEVLDVVSSIKDGLNRLRTNRNQFDRLANLISVAPVESSAPGNPSPPVENSLLSSLRQIDDDLREENNRLETIASRMSSLLG